MSKKKKVCIALTARGNYGKMKSVIRALKAHPSLEPQIIIGGSLVLEKYGRILESDVVDKFKIDHEIHFLIEGETPLTMAKSAGLAVTEFANAFENLKPDLVIVIADRFECLAITLAASYMNIPIAHVEGGELSGSIDEAIRHAITKMAHLHFPCSNEAAERIIQMGENRDSVFTVGATSFDVLSELELDDLSWLDDFQNVHGVGATIPAKAGEYLIVIQHPVTTEYERNLDHINETVTAIHGLGVPTFWLWPNMDAGSDGISKGIRMFREKYAPKHVHFFKSLPIETFAPLLRNAACIIGNSSSGIREAAFLGTPCVNIGTRQNGRERGPNVMDVDYSAEEITSAIKAQIDHGPYCPSYIYGDGCSGDKIVKILSEYEFSMQKLNTY